MPERQRSRFQSDLADQRLPDPGNARELRGELGQHPVGPAELRGRHGDAQPSRRPTCARHSGTRRRDWLEVTDGTSNDGLHRRDAPGPDQRRPRRGLDPGRGVHEPVHPQRDCAISTASPTRRAAAATGSVTASASTTRRSKLPCVTVPFPVLRLLLRLAQPAPGGVNAGFGDGSVRFVKDYDQRASSGSA